MKRPDEMEKYLANRSGIIGYNFYNIALLIFSIYQFMNTGELGIPFIILAAGLILYFVSNLYYRNNMK